MIIKPFSGYLLVLESHVLSEEVLLSGSIALRVGKVISSGDSTGHEKLDFVLFKYTPEPALVVCNGVNHYLIHVTSVVAKLTEVS